MGNLVRFKYGVPTRVVLILMLVASNLAFASSRGAFADNPPTIPGINGGTAYYLASTGHYYQYVPSTEDWNTANSHALAARANGMYGYLATITTSDENNLIKGLIPGGWTWFGGSDNANEGCWVYATGSSSDVQAPFYSINSPSNCSVQSKFTNWSPGEPNNANGNENFSVVNHDGNWNDIANSQTGTDWGPSGYLIEYGGRSDDPGPAHVLQAQGALSIGISGSLMVGANGTATISGGSGTGAVTLTSGSTGVCTVNGLIITPISAGSCNLQVSKAADANYLAASATASFTVATSSNAQTTQASLTFSISNALLTPSLTSIITVLGGSGTGSVTLTSNNPQVCSISGSGNPFTLTAISIGVCNFTAIKAADSNYFSQTNSGSLNISAPATASATQQTVLPVSSVYLGIPQINTNSAQVTVGKSIYLQFSVWYSNGCPTFSPRVYVGTAASPNLVNAYQAGAAVSCAPIPLPGTSAAQPEVTYVASMGIPLSTNPGIYSIYVSIPDSTGSYSTSNSSYLNIGSLQVVPVSLSQQAPLNIVSSNNSISPGLTTSISVTGGSGSGSISLSTGSPQICTVTGTSSPFTVNALSVGICNLTAAKAGDSTFSAITASTSVTVTVATSAPTATITPPSGASSISSTFTLTATGAIGNANSASIKYGCLTLDGSAFRDQATVSGYTNVSGNGGPAGNCYANYSSSGSANFNWSIDPTTWANGTHTFAFYVIDSNGKNSPTVSTSITVFIPLPTATLILPTGSNALSGKFALSGAGQSASGTNTYLNYACLTLDGSSSISGVMSTSGLYGGGYGNGGSCWNLSSRGTSANFSWNIDATNWTVGTHTFSLTVIDASGKQSPVSAGSVTIFNPLPTISFTNLTSGQTIKGKAKVSVSFGFSGNTSLSIRNIGISASNANPEFSSYYTYSSNLGSGINVYAAPSAGTATWDVDTTRLPIGPYDLRVGVEDSQGRTSFAELSLQVARPAPAISITSPSENSSIPGDLNIRLHVTPDSESQANIVAIGVDNKNLTPTFAGSSYYSNNSFPVGYANWGVNDLRDFSFSESAKLLSPGPLTLHFIVLDSDGYSTSSTLNLQVVSSNPIITAPTTSSDAVQISPFSYSINVQAASGSGAVIQYVGILENGAVPLTPGVPAQVQNEQLPSGVSLYSVSNGNSFGWTLNPKNWASGLHTISVYAIDSNGRVGTANTTYYVAPKATWKLTQREPAILGKSVLTSVAMSTDNNWRQDPPVVVQVQTGPSSTGPWTTLNPLTLDSTGAGGFRVTMENSALWVRVLHDVQDSVQTGFSAPIELLTVADTGSRGLTAQNGTRLVNPDGTTPKVVCQLAKGVGQLSCSASNVESSTQPISLQVLSGKQWNPVKSISLSNIKSISLPSPVRVKGKAVKSSYRLVGAGTDNNQNAFIPWTSNILQA